MGAADAAEQSLKAGDPAAALVHLQEQVRARPADSKLRVFLFQLMCVLGQWERALNQLKVASELDPGALAMAQMYGEAVRCEAIRRDVFAGRKSPMVFGEPDPWLAFLIESLLLSGRGEAAKSDELRRRAFDEADTSAGEINGQPFAWIADGDSRLGPVLETIINGKYYWVPFQRVSKVIVEAPEDLRDVVWMPAHLEFENGGESVALIPTRYPGSEAASDGTVMLARKTEWDEAVPGAYHGRGQRIFITDAGEVPLMDLRTLSIHQDAPPSNEAQAAEHG
jgi:type VI secretion system protein ImpE